jgi:hypothetical protein
MRWTRSSAAGYSAAGNDRRTSLSNTVTRHGVRMGSWLDCVRFNVPKFQSSIFRCADNFKANGLSARRIGASRLATRLQLLMQSEMADTSDGPVFENPCRARFYLKLPNNVLLEMEVYRHM